MPVSAASQADFHDSWQAFKPTPLWGPGRGHEVYAGFQPPAWPDSLHQSHTCQCAQPWPLRHRVWSWSSPQRGSERYGLQQLEPPWCYPHHSQQNIPGKTTKKGTVVLLQRLTLKEFSLASADLPSRPQKLMLLNYSGEVLINTHLHYLTCILQSYKEAMTKVMRRNLSQTQWSGWPFWYLYHSRRLCHCASGRPPQQHNLCPEMALKLFQSVRVYRPSSHHPRLWKWVVVFQLENIGTRLQQLIYFNKV